MDLTPDEPLFSAFWHTYSLAGEVIPNARAAHFSILRAHIGRLSGAITRLVASIDRYVAKSHGSVNRSHRLIPIGAGVSHSQRIGLSRIAQSGSRKKTISGEHFHGDKFAFGSGQSG